MDRRIRLVTFCAIFVSSASSAAPPLPKWGTWSCVSDEVTACGPRGDCAKQTPSVRAIVYPGTSMYERCTFEKVGERNHLKECHQAPMTAQQSPGMTTVEVTGYPVFLRLRDNLEFVDVAALDDWIFINRGKCVDAPQMIRIQPVAPK